MKQLRNTVKIWAAVAGILVIAVLLNGCKSPPPLAEAADDESMHGDVVKLQSGELVTVTFVAPGTEKFFPPHEERIQADGNITPPDVGPIKAVGKTVGELQSDLQKAYNKLYVHLTVTVKAGDRFYYVDGEVKQPGPKPYLGDTDIVKAIAAGSGFTDFAKMTKIRLIHPDGKTDIVNYNKAVEDPSYNHSVYPGDKIVVPRRFF